jgi:putative FmdB family regulatory protein
MPRYDYRCPHCEWHGELVLPMDHDKPKCFYCETELVQILHAPGVAFKGEGWTPKAPRNTKPQVIVDDGDD